MDTNIIKERKNRIMVVEDDADINRLISYNLSRSGFNSEAAYDGNEAKEKLNNEVFDVVILDIMLPGIDGFRICKAIKENPAAFKTFVVMLTARVEPQDKIYANLIGADCYLTKPFNVTELMETIKGLVDLRERQYSICPDKTMQKYVKRINN
ncbi:MAG: response regulator [Candidatus Omnitrophota bacterium]